MKKTSLTQKIILSITDLTLCLFVVLASPVYAVETTSPQSIDYGLDLLQPQLNLGSEDPAQIIASLINLLLSFLALIAVIVIIYSGFLFLFSFGNDDRMAKARKSFFQALIGLVIIIFSVPIVEFVINTLTAATSG